MQKQLFAALCLMTVTACTSPYGNYAKVTDSYNTQMADDAASELVALYPPATTHLALLQSARDAYGVELVSKLRENGYALEESEKASSKPKAIPAASLPIHYTVDNIGAGLYRVTISVSDHMMSRVYSVTGQDMLPAGAWTRKE
jgi:hypothetical protein